MPDQEAGFFGPLSTLTDVSQVCEDLGNLLSNLFSDYEPGSDDGQRAVYVLAASILRGETGEDELDEAIRERYLEIADRPRSRWEIEIGYADILRLANSIVASSKRPDTQVIGHRSLEMLVRDETAHSILAPPVGASRIADFEVDGRSFNVTVGPPSLELLIRCALRREGIDQLEVFEREKLFSYLVAKEEARQITEGNRARVSALRLLKVMARPGLLSLRIVSEADTAIEELEKVATAYRVRMAYEASIVYAPVLDVNHLDRLASQPSLARQLNARAGDFVEKIGAKASTGYLGDRLLGTPIITDEALALEYLRAVSAGDPFSAFMGYYHVLEYDLHDFWFNELREKVEAAGASLTRPAGGDLRGAATQAANLLGVREQDIKFTELRGLEALAGHLDIGMFARDLAAHLDGAIEYFASGQLPFVQVENLDFRIANDDAACRRIAGKLVRRIYFVRNAITHSKASAARYSPYSDDIYLIREVPLVRIAAEQLLIPREGRI